MLAPPSLQSEYALVYSGDSALNLPADETERANALRVARETGRWSAIQHAGQEPTAFVFRPIHGVARTWMANQARAKELTPDAVIELVFRLALVRVDNLPGLQLKHERVDGLPLLTLASMDQIYSLGVGDLGRDVVIELGDVVLTRTLQGVPPKS
jgi:hypothetical protein